MSLNQIDCTKLYGGSILRSGKRLAGKDLEVLTIARSLRDISRAKLAKTNVPDNVWMLKPTQYCYLSQRSARNALFIRVQSHLLQRDGLTYLRVKALIDHPIGTFTNPVPPL